MSQGIVQRSFCAGTLMLALGAAGLMAMPMQAAPAPGGASASQPRALSIPGSPVMVRLWEQAGPRGVVQPHYAIAFDGESFSEPRATSYVIKLKHSQFDPLSPFAIPAVEENLQAGDDTNVYIVQFYTQPLEEYRQAVRDLGGTVHSYLANHCHLVAMDPEVRDAVAALPFVRWVGPFHPAYRLSGTILDDLAGDADMNEPRWFSIQAFGRGAESQETIARRLEVLGGSIMNINPQGFRMTVTMSLAQLLDVVRMDETHFIDPWGPGELDMDIARQIGGAVTVLAPEGYTGQGVRGEIFDTEVDMDHPEWAGQEPLIHGDVMPASTHGTSCYGINFSTGVVNPQATGLLPDREQGIFCYYQISTQFGGPYTRHDLNAEATDPDGPYRSVFQTSSVGSPRTTEYTSISAETDDYLFLYDYLSCQSQSNAYDSQDSRPQAWAKNICSVGGITHHNTLDRGDDDYSSGSMGPAEDGRIKPDLSHFYEDIFTTTAGGGYTEFGGTSGATPITAGHYGLLHQMWHEGVFEGFGGGESVFDSRPKSTTARAMMINTAYRYVWYGAGAPNPDLNRNRQGWGMADVGELYNYSDRILIVDESILLTNGQSETFVVGVEGGEPLFRATMVYADPAGDPASSQARINDLSLRVTSPTGTMYWGNNGLHTSNFSTPGGEHNDVDVVESVFVEDPEPGSWAIEVIAHEINQDSHLETPGIDADFALCITGGHQGPGFGIASNPASQDICTPSDAIYELTISQVLGFEEPVTLSAADNPAGTTVTFSDNPVIPPATSTMTVTGTGAADPGSYTIMVTGTSVSMERSLPVGLGVFTAVPEMVSLISPPNGATDISIAPTLQWAGAAQASTYDLQIATDESFAYIVFSATTGDTSLLVTDPLETVTLYYWRVRGSNTCGDGLWSEAFTFTTQDSPIVLLVDDDDNSPDNLAAYTSTLDAMGVWYDVLDTGTTVDPTFVQLAPYRVVIWFTGDDWGGDCGPSSAGENDLAMWLDNGGCLFISSQDYHYDHGLTSFMDTYLGVSSVWNDESQQSVTGAGSVFGALGSYNLDFPFTNWSDVVNPDADAELAFEGSAGNAAVNKDGGVYRTTFFGYPLEAVQSVEERIEIMQALLEWCSGLVPECPEDVNGDGTVDVLDLLAIIAAWGATSGPEDVNGDGIVDVLDLLAVISAWGPCE